MIGYTPNPRHDAYTVTHRLSYVSDAGHVIETAMQSLVDRAARECVAAGIPENDAVAAIHARLRDTFASCAGELAARAIARYADKDTPWESMEYAFMAANAD